MASWRHREIPIREEIATAIAIVATAASASALRPITDQAPHWHDEGSTTQLAESTTITPYRSAHPVGNSIAMAPTTAAAPMAPRQVAAISESSNLLPERAGLRRRGQVQVAVEGAEDAEDRAGGLDDLRPRDREDGRIRCGDRAEHGDAEV